MPIHAPGPELGQSIPFKHLGGKGKHGRKDVNATLNLTAFVDMMTMLVVFLLMTFSATGEILMTQKGLELPSAINKEELKRAPIVTISADAITFNGEPMADPRTILSDTSMEWKIIELYERLKVEHAQFELQPMEEEKKKEIRGTVILQADKGVDAKILNRVMKTAYAAEYPNVMFAINQRARGK
ncbi:MAG: biopolymer transporter ExbD [Deltaproteobacteria bacterium]|nr:biopolymer transporter ExbD [Deltaproteobacteria bacterium]